MLKRKKWIGQCITIYENPVKSFLVVVESDDGEIISSSFHWFYKDALRGFNNEKARLQKESTSK